MRTAVIISTDITVTARVQARNRMHRAKKKEQKLRAAIAELDGTASSGTDSDPMSPHSSESTSTDQNHSAPAPTRPRVNAGMDRSAILDHCTRLSQVPSEFDSSSLEPLGVTLCSVAQFGRAIHLVSRHCALCPGAIPQIEVGTSGCAGNIERR